MTNHPKYYPTRLPVSLLLLVMFIALGSCRYARERGLLLDRELKKPHLSTLNESTNKNGTARDVKIDTQMTRVIESDSLVNNAGHNEMVNVDANIYYIIVGTFTIHANAEATAAIYNSKGYTINLIPSVTSRGEKAELVAVKAFPDREMANEFLSGFKASVDPKAWIYPRD